MTWTEIDGKWFRIGTTLSVWTIVQATTSHDGDRIVGYYGRGLRGRVRAMVALRRMAV